MRLRVSFFAIAMIASGLMLSGSDPAAIAQGFPKKGPPSGAKTGGPGAKGGAAAVKGANPIQPLSKGPVKELALKDMGALRPGPVSWVDMHIHLVPGRSDFSGAVSEAVKLMDQAGIATAVVMPTPQSPGVYTERDYVRFLKAHPGRFAWLAGGGDLNDTIHRTRPDKVSDAIKRDFVSRAEAALKAGARGFGEITILHLALTAGHPFEETPADHPLLLALADVAGAHSVAISMHLDLVPTERETPAHLLQYGNPRKLQGNLEAFGRLLAHNRKARFVFEHAGSDPVGFAAVDILRKLADENENLFFGIRAAPTFFGSNGVVSEWLEFLKSHPDRFVFGSDSFVLAPGVIAGPGKHFAQRNVNKLILHNRILGSLPRPIAQKIAIETPLSLLGLK